MAYFIGASQTVLWLSNHVYALTPNPANSSLSVYLLRNEIGQIDQTNIKEKSSSLYTQNGTYKGTPWKNERTIDVKTVAETKFARCDVHTVRSEDGINMVNDWIFMEEMDAVNVLVRDQHNKFALFKQKKYAIPGETYSPVGGFVDQGEAPWESARREVMEELGLGSRKTLEEMKKVMLSSQIHITDTKLAFKLIPKTEKSTDSFGLAVGDTIDEDTDWVFLGRYRTAANRGGGFIYTYLLKNAVPIAENGGKANFVSQGDDEDQEIHFLTYDELQSHVRSGMFQEVKWAATIALALLHLQSEQQ